MKVVYLAHPVGAPTQREVNANIESAKTWYRWCCDNHPDCAFVANWIVDVEVYAGTDILSNQDPEHPDRLRGLERDDAVITKCDEFWLVGDRLSGGMRRGLEVAKKHGLVIKSLLSHADLG